MIAYILKYENDLVCVTNSPEEWLKENNKRRIVDGEEPEDLSIFQIEEKELFIYGEREDSINAETGKSPSCEVVEK